MRGPLASNAMPEVAPPPRMDSRLGRAVARPESQPDRLPHDPMRALVAVGCTLAAAYGGYVPTHGIELDGTHDIAGDH